MSLKLRSDLLQKNGILFISSVTSPIYDKIHLAPPSKALSLLRRNELENATITGQFGFVFEENAGREVTWLSWRHRFWKVLFFQNVFCPQ